MKVALYARTSTVDKQDPEMQLRDLRQYAAARGFTVSKEYVDRMSGTTTRRPALDELMADARRGGFQAVMVWRFDRMGRSTVHLIQCMEEFRSLGVDFISFTEAIDTSSSIGTLVFSIFASLAAFERSLIIERIHGGLRNARAKGKHLGRPKQRDDNAVLRLHSKGLSQRAIALQLGISKGTVQNSLAHGKPKIG